MMTTCLETISIYTAIGWCLLSGAKCGRWKGTVGSTFFTKLVTTLPMSQLLLTSPLVFSLSLWSLCLSSFPDFHFSMFSRENENKHTYPTDPIYLKVAFRIRGWFISKSINVSSKDNSSAHRQTFSSFFKDLLQSEF